MPTTRHTKKTNWSDIGDLRKPNATWRLGNAAKCIESLLGLENGAVVFRLPDGQFAEADMNLGCLRSEWQRHLSNS